MLSFQQFYRSLILGNDKFILSYVKYKRILLTGQLCVITMLICVSYMIFDFLIGRPYTWSYQLACASLALVSFLLNRQGRYMASKLVLGISVNITVFLFASSEPLEVGLYMYFIPVALGSMIAFGYEERVKATAFVLLSAALFIISLFSRIEFVPQVPYTEEYIRVNTLVNFFGAGSASVCILYFLIQIHHRSEAVLIHNEKEIRKKNETLTTLNADLDRFVYSTSHDLRSPLSSMKGLIQIMEMSTEVSDLQRSTTEIKKRIDYLEKFIRDIADYSRNRTQGLLTQRIQVHALLIESLDCLRYFPGASELLINIEADEDLVVHGDHTRLQVVLNNLLSNAFKYRDTTKEKSFVIMRAEFVNDMLTITIEDNGLGIPADYVSKVFDMYVRVHEISQGSGLGLYIVKETIEKLGGTISVTSEVYSGSCFTITVPATLAVSSGEQSQEILPAS